MSFNISTSDSQQLSVIGETIIVETGEPITSPASTPALTSELTGNASHASSLRSVFKIFGPDGRAIVSVEIAA